MDLDVDVVYNGVVEDKPFSGLVYSTVFPVVMIVGRFNLNDPFRRSPSSCSSQSSLGYHKTMVQVTSFDVS